MNTAASLTAVAGGQTEDRLSAGAWARSSLLQSLHRREGEEGQHHSNSSTHHWHQLLLLLGRASVSVSNQTPSITNIDKYKPSTKYANRLKSSEALWLQKRNITCQYFFNPLWFLVSPLTLGVAGDWIPLCSAAKVSSRYRAATRRPYM